MASKIATAKRPRTEAERALREAARDVYAEGRSKGRTPAQAWDRVTDLVDCDLVGRVLADEQAARQAAAG